MIVYVRCSRGKAKNSGFMIGSPVATARRTWASMYGVSRLCIPIVVCDASKIGRASLAVICRPREVDELITDGTADEAALDELHAAGVHVITV